MKLTLFIDSLYGGGAERVICNLANYLAECGQQVEILTMAETEQSYDLNENISLQTLLPIKERRGKLWNFCFRFFRFIRYLVWEKKDVYIVMLPKTIIMLLMFKWLTKAKIIASERADPTMYPKVISRLLKKYASRADGWVFQTKDARKWYEKSIQKCQAIIIPNAINSSFIRPLYIGPKRNVVASAGRLVKQKNFELLIRAFSLVALDYPEYNLVIYGEGNEKEELNRLIFQLGLEKRIFLPGNIKNIAEEMEKNSLFVLPSDFEGMPNALMEAMALGLPCISTDCPCGGPRFLIQNGINGLLVPVKDESKMAEALKEVLSNSEKAKDLGIQASKIIEKLAPAIIYAQWENFIKNILKE